MEAFVIEKSAHSPGIKMDPDEGVVEFEGNFVVPDAVSFFKPVLGWLDAYFKEVGKPLMIRIKFDYFNTSASKVIQNMLMQIKQAIEDGAPVAVEWYYRLSDEDMAEMAQEAEEIAEIDIKFVVDSTK